MDIKYNILTNKNKKKETRKENQNGVSLYKEEFNKNTLNSELFFEKNFGLEWLSTKSAAAILGITPNALRIRKCRGQVQYRYFGKYLRFNLSYLSTLFSEERQVRKE